MSDILKANIFRTKEFRQMHRELSSKGVQISEAIKMVKGETSVVSGSGFSLSNFIAVCKGYGINPDVEGVLKPIMATFDLDQFGEVPVG